MPAPLYTPEFWTAYRAAMSTDEPMPEVRRVKVGSIAAAVRGYYGSTEFKVLAETTKATYRGVLDRFVDKHGEGPIAGLQPKHINKLIDEMADTPSAASNFRKRLKGLMDYAVSAGMRSDNPVVVAKRVKLKTTGHRTWTEEDISAFRKRHNIGTPLRLAMEVLLHTGLRRSDAVRLGWKHLTKDGFVISTKKSQGHVELCIPVHSDLARYIADCPKDGPAFIATMYGRARSEKAFSTWISEAACDAGLPPRSSPHGLRKAACRRLAETGCTALEIMSITGHTDIREIERYCREAARKKLAVSAMAKLEGGFDIRLPNPPDELGKNDDNLLKSSAGKTEWRSQQDSNLQPAE
ncbi:MULTISPECIES: tyrosine-type recombinase/integrase [unclassified Bradyrhizobium]|uniref:tyrosine-type recombinase/integrase n=1 Tax=Bradyrhizobium sp. S3.9.2 TaxID=3156432 RepID=UPI0033976188